MYKKNSKKKIEKMKTKKDLKELIAKYFEDTCDSLSTPGQVFTAIAWSNFPNKSFCYLINKIEKIHKPSAEIISSSGMVFYVLGLNDIYRNSVYRNMLSLSVDTEGWDENVPKNKRYWTDDDSELLFDKIYDAIADFEDQLMEEIKSQLYEWGLSIQQIYDWFDTED